MNIKQKAVILSVCLLLILLFLLLPVIRKNLFGEDLYQSDTAVTVDGKKYIEKPLSTVLVMGLDDFGAYQQGQSYNNTSQSDFLALVALDHRNKTYSVLSVNRDTMAKIDEIGVTGDRTGDTVTAQIALAHTYGDGGTVSCVNTVRAVSRLLMGVGIDSYIAMTMDAVGVINDAVGGVPVTMNADYTDLDPTFEKGKTVTLMGNAALRFVRARMGTDDGTNLARMERQKTYLEAFLNVLSEADVDMLGKGEAYGKLSEFIFTDISVAGLSDLASDLSDYRCEGIFSLSGMTDTETGYTRFFADEDALKRLVLSLYFEECK